MTLREYWSLYAEAADVQIDVAGILASLAALITAVTALLRSRRRD